MRIVNSWDSAAPHSAAVKAMVERIIHTFANTRSEGVIYIELWSEDHLPNVELIADRIIRPDQTLSWGEMLAATAGVPVYFHSMGPRSTRFVLKSAMLASDDDEVDPERVEDYGTPITEVSQVWVSTAAFNEAEQRSEEQVVPRIFGDGN